MSSSSGKNPTANVTRFLNVDLELVSTDDLGPLLAYLSDMTFILRDSLDDQRRTVWIELASDPRDADLAILDLTKLIQSLPRDLRRLWDRCEDRCLNVGVQAGLAPHSRAFRISAARISAIASVSARVEVTVYGASAESKNEKQRPT